MSGGDSPGAAAPDAFGVYLLQFASCEYAQFRLAEFASLAGMRGLRFGTVLTGVAREFPEFNSGGGGTEDTLWSDRLFDSPSGAAAGIHDWSGASCNDADDYGLSLCVRWWRTRPLVVISCSSDDEDERKLRWVVERSAMVKRLLRVWHSTESLTDMLADVSSGCLRRQLAENRRRFDLGDWATWRMCVELVNVSPTMAAKVGIVEQFASAGLEMPGRVDLKRPQFELYYLEHWRYDLTAGGVTDKSPVRVYMAEQLPVHSLRSILPRMSLSKRVFIGNTSMNVQLAFVMCNLARLAKGQLVVDPFVGSGSILVSAGHLGAYCVGQDVDYNIVLGLGKSTKAEMRRQKRCDGECLSANFGQYGISDRYVDCLVGDASQHVGLWRRAPLFDAVLTDPPYGIRERSRKVKRDPDGGPKKLDQEYFPPKVHYSLEESVSDLLNFAAMRLVPGGRCVYWFPVIQSDYRGSESLPKHPKFRLISSAELPMTMRTSRVLVCAERLPDVAAGDPSSAGSSGVSVGHDHHQLRSVHFSGGAGKLEAWLAHCAAGMPAADSSAESQS